MPANTDNAAICLGSLLTFTQTFYKLRTGRDFELSYPIGHESHFVIICRALTRVLRGEINRLIINIPPRYGKTELMINFIAWAMAHYPDANFIYTSYSGMLAEKQTATIKEIMTGYYYQQYFGVKLKGDTKAKGNFETVDGGSIYAVGTQGTITGRGAGIARCDRFGGAIVIDDNIKPEDALSDTVRTKSNEWFFNTLISRRNNDDKTPIIFIGQRLHEDDLAAQLIAGTDGHEWEKIILPALNTDDDTPLYPEKHSTEFLHNMRDTAEYMFASQMQQNPQPAGGGIFKKEHFIYLYSMPQIIGTFITVDTGESKKVTSDQTVFSFWGVYKVGAMYALMWLDCRAMRVEPADLQPEFISFLGDCRRFDVPPNLAVIEKKSTGTTLASVMGRQQGLQVIALERPGTSNKIARFVRCQEYVGAKLISFMVGAPHAEMCINHMSKITINNTHAHDDIADTMADAVDLALIKKSLPFQFTQIQSAPTESWGSVI